MSDEPPPLRLKPRLTSDAALAATEPAARPPAPAEPLASPADEASASPKLQLRPKSASPEAAPAEAVPPPVAASAEPPRPRLKPRLSTETAAVTDAAPAAAAESVVAGEPSAASSVPAVPPIEAVPPAVTVPPAATLPPAPPTIPAVVPTPSPADPALPPPLSSPGEAPKFRLKPKSTDSTPTTLPVTAPPPLPVTSEAPPATADAEAPPAGAPKIPHVRAPHGAVPEPVAPLPAEHHRAFRFGVLAVVFLVLGVFGGGGYFAWQLWSSPDVPAPTASPAAGKAREGAVSMPGKMIEKAENVIADRRGHEQARVDAVVAGEDPPEKRAFDTPPPSTFTKAPPAPSGSEATRAPVTTAIAPGVTATTTELVATPDASAAFKAFVANARVSSVVAGTSARAFVNGRLIRVGDVADESLGVTLDRVDSERRLLIFKDPSGVTVAKKY